MRTLTALLTAILLAWPAVSPSAAEPAADFYKSNDLTLVVATAAGGGYDTYARALAPYLKRHIPGQPNVIVQNMPGAGGLIMANYLFNKAKPDGSVIGLTLSTVVLNQLTQPNKTRYDAARFAWLGTIDSQTNVLVLSTAKTKVRSIAEAKNMALNIGTTNANSFLYQEPAMMNALLGTQFKLVGGYKGVKDLNLALERGEIDGHLSPWSTLKSQHSDWLKSGKVIVIIRTGAPTDDLPAAPQFIDLVKGDRDTALVGLLDMSSILGRSLAAPPGTPADRVQALRTGVAAAINDPEFVSDMTKRKLPIQFQDAEKLQAFVAKGLKTPPETVKTFLELVAPKK